MFKLFKVNPEVTKKEKALREDYLNHIKSLSILKNMHENAKRDLHSGASSEQIFLLKRTGMMSEHDANEVLQAIEALEQSVQSSANLIKNEQTAIEEIGKKLKKFNFITRRQW